MSTVKTKVVFTDLNVHVATVADIQDLKELLNSAYRGESSRQGWTTEAHLITGDVRSDDASIKHAIEGEGSVLLKYVNEKKEIIGCVNLQRHGNKIYLGMFAVNPLQQGGGVGKKLLQAAEEYSKSINSNSIYMTVISVRSELIDWYKRHGYKDTGERKPFYEDAITGKHVQQLEFIVLEKCVK